MVSVRCRPPSWNTMIDPGLHLVQHPTGDPGSSLAPGPVAGVDVVGHALQPARAVIFRDR